jgi:tRNA threonylcarbamoyladenosine biosynthesis protein TsaE
MREPLELSWTLGDEAATRAAGGAFAHALAANAGSGAFLTLAGELGAGKTTFVRGLLAALGVPGPIRSPTYTLLESYGAGARTVHHLDWYRLAGDDELESLGFRDLLADDWIVAEWPERAPDAARAADVQIRLEYAADGGRRLVAAARTAAGHRLLAHLMPDRASE